MGGSYSCLQLLLARVVDGVRARSRLTMHPWVIGRTGFPSCWHRPYRGSECRTSPADRPFGSVPSGTVGPGFAIVSPCAV
uniref:Putative secreted protein n=1 Tax=Anopheles triannulatus TaxID=58253 RepID=A0A2M4B0L5_9DIPT